MFNPNININQLDLAGTTYHKARITEVLEGHKQEEATLRAQWSKFKEDTDNLEALEETYQKEIASLEKIEKQLEKLNLTTITADIRFTRIKFPYDMPNEQQRETHTRTFKKSLTEALERNLLMQFSIQEHLDMIDEQAKKLNNLLNLD